MEALLEAKVDEIRALRRRMVQLEAACRVALQYGWHIRRADQAQTKLDRDRAAAEMLVSGT